MLLVSACASSTGATSNALQSDGGEKDGGGAGTSATDVGTFGCPPAFQRGSLDCGAAPHVTISGMPIEIGGAPIGAGVVVDSPFCPSEQPITVTGADGAYSFSATRNTPVYFRLMKCGYYPMLSPEVSVPVDISGANVFMVNTQLSMYLPHYSATTSTVLVYVYDVTPSCDRSGVSVSAPGHPEAIVSYPSSSTAATSAAGFAVLEGLVPGGFTTLVADKAGCTVRWTQDAQTGRVPLEAGAISLILATFK